LKDGMGQYPENLHRVIGRAIALRGALCCAAVIVACLGAQARATVYDQASGGAASNAEAAIAADRIVLYNYPETFTQGFTFQNDSRPTSEAPLDWGLAQLIVADQHPILSPTAGSADFPAQTVGAASADDVVQIKMPADLMPSDLPTPSARAPADASTDGDGPAIAKPETGLDDLGEGTAPVDLSMIPIYIGAAGLLVVVALIAVIVAWGGKLDEKKKKDVLTTSMFLNGKNPFQTIERTNRRPPPGRRG
jgi:hypothetical protein